MSRPFRLGFVGAGKVTQVNHLPAALSCPDVEVTALVDTNISRARDLVERFGLKARVATSLQDVLGDMDGAVIATPNHIHRPLSLTCIEAGVHVLVEKPLATTEEDAEAIVEASEAHGVTVSVGYCERYLYSVQSMQSLIKTEYFGIIRRFAYQFGGRGGWSPVSGYMLDRKAAGGGVLIVSGTHFLDRMLYWFGFPDEVVYKDDSLGGPEATVQAQVRYTSRPDPLVGDILLSKTVALPRGFVMETDQGLVLLPDGVLGRILFRPEHNPEMEHTIELRGGVRQENMYRLQLQNFVQASRTGAYPAVTVRQGLDNVRLIRAFYAAREVLEEDWYEQARGTRA